ncbi:MAG: sensor histidine kinase [Pikeienuella sp.]
MFLPSVARYREEFLNNRLHLAEIAAHVLLASDDDDIESTLGEELLTSAGVQSVVFRREDSRQLILQAPGDQMIAETYDLRDAGMFRLVIDALQIIANRERRMIRVIGEPTQADTGGNEIEITLSEDSLCRAVVVYAERTFLISFLISAVTGFLIFCVTRRLIVRPMQRVVGAMTAFQKDPEREDPIRPSGSSLEEIVSAETALAAMQEEMKSALRQKSRLADLGAAVAKISHDLRNMLASAQLLADRLADSRDPVVSGVGPKLINSVDRAAALCESTLRHGKAEEAPPAPRQVELRSLAADVRDTLPANGGAISYVVDAPAGLCVRADPDHLFRILSNLSRNAVQAIQAEKRSGRVLITAKPEQDRVVVIVADDGPGLPSKALENLFQPFRGGARRGGAGLGLAIASELATLNGGKLELANSGSTGAAFRLTLPA